VNRYATLYLVTLLVIVPLDFLFLGVVAKDFFTSQVGNMLGEIKLAPAILFYLLYVVGTVVFVSGGQGATWQSTLLYGALFGFFCYATFDLTSLALLKHWSWPVAIVDITWGALVTAVSSTAGLLVANWLDDGFDCFAIAAVTSAAARCGCRASAPSSQPGRSSSPHRR
jgi:uncharacterized membrane protein